MPNGSYEFTSEEWTIIERYFDDCEKVLHAFTEKYGCFIDKYYHGDSTWNLRFRHPLGGEATVQLQYDISNRRPVISGIWHIDVYDEFSRYIRWGERKSLEDNYDLMHELQQMLRTVLNWQRDEMTRYDGYKKIWGRYSKEEFEKMVDPQIGELKHIDDLKTK